jgi:hypothetical protein
MKVTATSTKRFNLIDGVVCREWDATTENGTPCILHVRSVQADERFDVAEFTRDLDDQPAPDLVPDLGERIDPDMREILGLPLNAVMRLAEAMRAIGKPLGLVLPHTQVDERAAVLYWLIRVRRANGVRWKEVIGRILGCTWQELVIQRAAS